MKITPALMLMLTLSTSAVFAAPSTPASPAEAASAPAPLATARKEIPYAVFKEKSLKYVTLRLDNLKQEQACIEKSDNYDDLTKCVELARKNFAKTAMALNPPPAASATAPKK